MDEETHRPRGNKELESVIMQVRDLEMRSRAANGGLEDEADRGRAKLEFAASKRDDHGERTRTEVWLGDWSLEAAPNLSLNLQPQFEL